MSARQRGGTRSRETSKSVTAPGRGKVLSASEEMALVELCLAYKGDRKFSEYTKSFWVQVSKTFSNQARRQYSWQSCRRRMVAWELRQDNRALANITAESAQSYTPGLSTRSSKANNVLREAADDDEDDDDDGYLPQLPVSALRRDHTKCEQDVITVRRDLCSMIMDGMATFETQLQCFTTTLEKPEEQRRLYEMWNSLKLEVCKAVDKHEQHDNDASPASEG